MSNDFIENNLDMDTNSANDDLFYKTDLIELNNSWNDNNERIIISIGENAASYKWMHEKSSYYNSMMYNTISIIIIILSTVLSTETIVPDDNEKPNDVLPILKRVIIYMITVLSVIQTFLKSQEKSEKHMVASIAFSDLYHDIQQQMCMYRRDRLNARKYVGDCLKKYDSLIINTPDINSYIVYRFKRLFKNSNISLPGIADRIQKIEIITEPIKTNTISKSIMRSDKDVAIDLDNNIDVCNNLSLVHNAFQIHGDISDKDLQKINHNDLKKIKDKFMEKRSDYEYKRFLQHSEEND